MAYIGMRYPVYAPITAYTEGTGVTYGTGGVVGAAISASLTWNRADNTLYGDDVAQDVDNSVASYTISFSTTDVPDEVRSGMLGETVTDGVYSVTGDPAPDVGFGYIRVRRVHGQNTFEGWWFHKLKFSLGTEEANTKGENIEWGTPALEGKGAGIYNDASGKTKFADHKTFTTEADAKAWLKGLAHIS